MFVNIVSAVKETQELDISLHVNESDIGELNFTCWAQNSIGTSEKSFTLYVKPAGKKNLFLFLVITVVILQCNGVLLEIIDEIGLRFIAVRFTPT